MTSLNAPSPADLPALRDQIRTLLNQQIDTLWEQVETDLWRVADNIVADNPGTPRIDGVRAVFEQDGAADDGRTMWRFSISPYGQNHLTEQQRSAYAQSLSELAETFGGDAMYAYLNAREARAKHLNAPEDCAHIEKGVSRDIDLAVDVWCGNCNGINNPSLPADARCLCDESVTDHDAAIVMATIDEMLADGLPTSTDALVGSLRWQPGVVDTVLHRMKRDGLLEAGLAGNWNTVQSAPAEDPDAPSLRRSDRKEAAVALAAATGTSPRRWYSRIDERPWGTQTATLLDPWVDPDRGAHDLWESILRAEDVLVRELGVAMPVGDSDDAPAGFYDGELLCGDHWGALADVVLSLDEEAEGRSDALDTALRLYGGGPMWLVAVIPSWVECSVCGTSLRQ